MKVLHVNSYYFTNKIHFNFRKSLENSGILSEYFIPVYKNGNRNFEDNEVTSSRIYTWYDKIFFFSKTLKALRAINKIFDLRKFDLIHAHTLISDGLIAYILFKLYKKEYIVTVRNSDVNFFIPNIVFRKLGYHILKNAKNIICLSPTYKVKINSIYSHLSRKIDVIPNGVDTFWLNNINLSPKDIDPKHIKLIFVGRVDENKNLNLLIDFLKVNSDRRYSLTVVGRNDLGYDFNKLNRSMGNSNDIRYIGELSSKEELINAYRENSIFVMLSFKESFGVSYLEALSQGLPIIYTKKEGVDGFFDQVKVGYSSSPTDLKELKANIDYILEDYQLISNNAIKEIIKFDWKSIVLKYLNVIKS